MTRKKEKKRVTDSHPSSFMWQQGTLHCSCTRSSKLMSLVRKFEKNTESGCIPIQRMEEASDSFELLARKCCCGEKLVEKAWECMIANVFCFFVMRATCLFPFFLSLVKVNPFPLSQRLCLVFLLFFTSSSKFFLDDSDLYATWVKLPKRICEISFSIKTG